MWIKLKNFTFINLRISTWYSRCRSIDDCIKCTVIDIEWYWYEGQNGSVDHEDPEWIHQILGRSRVVRTGEKVHSGQMDERTGKFMGKTVILA